MKSIVLFVVLVQSFLFTSCGTTKTVYAETKMQICEDACKLRFSKHDYTGLSKCRSECKMKFREDVK